MQIEDYDLARLRRLVAARFGAPVYNATHCERLAEALARDTRGSISGQTLRRFFGLVKSTAGTSRYTLDTLARYCGYTDIEHCREAQTGEELQLFFRGEEDPQKNYWDKGEELCAEISASPELLVSLHRRLMAYPLAQAYFLELHPSRDMLCTVYTQYFEAYLKYKRTNEARLFAYSFLFLGAYLGGNEEFVATYAQKVQETPATREVFVIPAANKYGVTLLYAHHISDEALYRETWGEMLKMRKAYAPKSRRSVCSFEYTVLEFLIFTNRNEDMAFLMENMTRQKHADRDFVTQKRKECHDTVWQILCATALLKGGRSDEARAKLAKTDIRKLNCGWCKYYSILYYQALLQLPDTENRAGIFATCQKLLAETGLWRLEWSVGDGTPREEVGRWGDDARSGKLGVGSRFSGA